MAINIEFEQYDEQIVNSPTFVLMTRSGEKIGVLQPTDENIRSYLNSADEISFKVYKEIDFHNEYHQEPKPPYSLGDVYYATAYDNDTSVAGQATAGVAVVGTIGRREVKYVCTTPRLEGEFNPSDWSEGISVSSGVWDRLTDFKLIWCREWNQLFEAYVETADGEGVSKFVTGTALGEAETSQIMLYDIQINTEDDIARKDYKPTVFYDPFHTDASLLHRVTDKAPHYEFAHVDSTLVNIQRTFTFDNKSLYDSLQEIAEEVHCLFKFDCYLDEDMNIVRTISAYDLESTCNSCGYRGEFLDKCPECGSTDVNNGYGEDTGIFFSVDNLTDEITYSTDTGSVKNCFKLVAGDDVMTAAIRAINPNGSDYIYYISDEVKSDMSPELVAKINSYDALYDYYYKDYEYDTTGFSSAYNTVVNKYNNAYHKDYPTISSPLVGYPAITEAYYYAQDFYYYLSDSLMPDVSMQNTTAAIEAAKLTPQNLSPVAVANLSVASASTAESAVLGMAKVTVDDRYTVSAHTNSYTNHVWNGYFTVTNFSDDEDTAQSETISITISDDYETYVRQKIDKAMNREMMNTDGETDIVSLFKLELAPFKEELKKYNLTSLEAFRENCQTIIDILIEQGVANKASWASGANDLYTNLYIPYRNKLAALESEIALRESELKTVSDTIDNLNAEMQRIHGILDFQSYVGDELWLEFVSYRREDEYHNDNYISDGLSNSEVIARAIEFIDIAKKEIEKSATLQHQIEATLSNLLVMPEFRPLVHHFETGNWIRCKVDDKVYKLRLIEYDVDFQNLDKINVVFSDVTKFSTGLSDIQQVLDQAASVATSYSTVMRQANKGDNANKQLSGWVHNGLSLTTMKIVNTADRQNISWDDHGLLARRYDDIADIYDDQQLKIINNGLYVTDDNWLTSKAGIGEFTFFNPKTQQTETQYGVIADYLVGSYILGEEAFISNEAATVGIDENGISVSGSKNKVLINPNATYLLDVQKGASHLMYLDGNGDLNITGAITATSLSLGSEVKIPEGNIDKDFSIYIYKDGTVGTTPADGQNGFKVASNGVLTASNAVIYGTLYSSAGKIGGWTLATNAIYNGTNSMTSTTAGTYIGTGGIRQYKDADHYVNIQNGVVTAKGANITGAITATSLSLGSGVKIPVGNIDKDFSIYIAKDGTVGKTPAEGENGFKVASSGVLTASNAVIYGTLYSSAGHIAGWSISATSFSKANAMKSGTAATQYQTVLYAPSAPASTDLAIQIHKRSYDGSAYGSWGNTFYVRYDGYMAAYGGGRIGAWYLGSGTGDGGGLYNGMTSLTDTTHDGVWIGPNGIALGKGAFKVTDAGALTATNATISGKITAKSGTIGGFYISSSANTGTSAAGGHFYTTSLYAQSGDGTYEYEVGIKGDGNSTTEQSSNVAFYVKRMTKGAKWSTAENIFYITKSGAILAQKGSIGGWTLGSSAIYHGTNSMTSTTAGTYIGTGGIRQYKDANNYVNIQNGVVTAKGANITGTITSSSATITGGSVNISASSSTDNRIIIKNTASGVTFTSNIQPLGIEMTQSRIPNSGNNDNVGSHAKYQGHGFASYVQGYSSAILEYLITYGTTYGYRAALNMRLGRSSNVIAQMGESGDGGGFLGLRKSDATQMAYINGASGEIGYHALKNLSDRRKKKDIETLNSDQASEFIYGLHPVKYKYRDVDNDKYHHGFVAQEVESILDDDTWGVVSQTDSMDAANEDGSIENLTKYKTLSYTEMIADLVATVQSQNERISQLEQMLLG